MLKTHRRHLSKQRCLMVTTSLRLCPRVSMQVFVGGAIRQPFLCYQNFILNPKAPTKHILSSSFLAHQRQKLVHVLVRLFEILTTKEMADSRCLFFEIAKAKMLSRSYVQNTFKSFLDYLIPFF